MSRQTPGAEVGLGAMAAYSIAVLAIPAAHLAYELIPAGILLAAWIRVGDGIRSALLHGKSGLQQ